MKPGQEQILNISEHVETLLHYAGMVTREAVRQTNMKQIKQSILE